MDFRFRYVKILGNPSGLPAFLPYATKNPLFENFPNLKQMKFRVDFGAKDEARLTPCEDDKPKDTEITLFKAVSDYSLEAICL